jgi:type IV pilus assembly protein PilA
MKKLIENREEQGFTLIELLIAIVVVGILAAVAIVGIAGLTDTGSKSACTSSADAAKAASAAYYANNGNQWPADFAALTGGANPVYEAPSGATNPTATTMKVGSWTLTMTGGGSTPNTFSC